jgi:TRAP-type uncharacterized transport system substrate-binding protein
MFISRAISDTPSVGRAIENNERICKAARAELDSRRRSMPGKGARLVGRWADFITARSAMRHNSLASTKPLTYGCPQNFRSIFGGNPHMALPEHWANPIATRSLLVLEIASELVSTVNPFWQAKIQMRVQGAPDWQFSLYGSGTIDGIHAVVKRESALAIVNPSTALALAYRGLHPFDCPQPVRSIAVIPTADQYVFAVRGETGLRIFEDIARAKYPLRLSVRAIRDHSVHFMLDHIMEVAGFSIKDLESWGGSVRYEGAWMHPGDPKFAALLAGEIDAIFDEASDAWLNEAVEAGMTILPLAEETVQKLEARGFRRAFLKRDYFKALPDDILTVDFSGWPVFVHEEAPDELVTAFCAALDARKAAIPWQGYGPLPVERMTTDAEDTPQDVPLHPAAERFWRQRGYLK